MDEMIDAKVGNAFKRYLHEKETIQVSGTGTVVQIHLSGNIATPGVAHGRKVLCRCLS
jgi:hypothetical protein